MTKWYMYIFRLHAKVVADLGLSLKEVIQPQVPLQLPCYDLTPVISSIVAGCFPCGLAHQVLDRPNSHGLTGSVYKARERIHRGMLIHDY